jgi:hypothetical protein
MSTGFQVASVAGPALAGLMIAIHKSATLVYVLDAAMTLTYFAFIRAITSPPMERTHEEGSPLKALLAGCGFVWRTKVILAAITLDMFAVLLGGATALLPIYAKNILQVGPFGFGWLRAAPAMGAMMMALILAHRPPLQKAGSALLWAVVGFGVATIIFGFSQWFWLSMLMLLLAGALDNISVVIRHSLVQLRTPDYMRGRVSAVNAVFISASNELGAFESGTVATLFSPVISVVSGGIGTIVVVIAVALLWPQIRRLKPLYD